MYVYTTRDTIASDNLYFWHSFGVHNSPSLRCRTAISDIYVCIECVPARSTHTGIRGPDLLSLEDIACPIEAGSGIYYSIGQDWTTSNTVTGDLKEMKWRLER